jgi:hypothetical protein
MLKRFLQHREKYIENNWRMKKIVAYLQAAWS